ncbi:MAG TPA: DUF1501 domain-containing protein [Candidatus Limnocylindria bacterium]|nr:DUF1501 domain-containing protein [Candidatus Limnocylindria bacterium]
MKRILNRRDMLRQCSAGFGLMALNSLMSQSALAGAAKTISHFRPRAKSVIFCYMSGGVSHLDSFDPKPLLKRMAGKPMPVKVERTVFNQNGNIFPSPFEFRQYGAAGIPISSMFPKLAQWCAEDLAIIRSMTTKVSEHAQGNYAFHTGFPFMGFPSAGAWVNYGLGSENQNLPGFVVLQSGGAVPPHGGVGLYSNGFLPAQHQASIIIADSTEPVPNIRAKELDLVQRGRLDFVRDLDTRFASASGHDAQVDAAIKNYETAYRMQSSVPELVDLSGETAATRKLYGLEDSHPQTAAYGRQCLLARRLVERGVRFVELSCINEGIGAGNAPNPWDQHGDLERGHGTMAHQVDQPIAGLLVDLKQRGLLDETLVIWAGEFGRTPFSQGSNGRDHNPYGFSIWMAGGGVKGGTIYGATDDLGYHVVDRPVSLYDLWATVLHQLGLNHENLTYLSGGRNFRLTDVYGTVLHDILS